MVQLMLEGFGGDARRRKPVSDDAAATSHGIECYHVNARFSRGLSDIGEFQGAKMLLIVWFWLQSLWIRFRYGVTNFYYIPAPGKSVALYRDWLVMSLCRPFFKNVILHWEAAGLGKWLETSAQIRSRAITYRLFKPVNLSMVLSRYNVADAEKFLSRNIVVVNNGIPDPCPDYLETIQPQRRVRFAVRLKLFAGMTPTPREMAEAGDAPDVIKVLFLANGLREKGLFAAMRGVVAANRSLQTTHRSLRMKLVFAGNFMTTEERKEFDQLLQLPEFASAVTHAGFVSGASKLRVLREADMFCFPTQYLGENQPVCLIEAMAFGLPIVTTRWRSLPEMLPPDYPGLVPGQDPEEIASTLLKMATIESSDQLFREMFLKRFSLDQYLSGLAAALHRVDE